MQTQVRNGQGAKHSTRLANQVLATCRNLLDYASPATYIDSLDRLMLHTIASDEFAAMTPETRQNTYLDIKTMRDFFLNLGLHFEMARITQPPTPPDNQATLDGIINALFETNLTPDQPGAVLKVLGTEKAA